MPASHRLQTLLQHLQPNLSRPTDDHVATHAASANPPQPLNKICTAQEALQLVNNNDVVTVCLFYYRCINIYTHPSMEILPVPGRWLCWQQLPRLAAPGAAHPI